MTVSIDIFLLELRKYHTLLLLVSDCLLYEVESAPGKWSSVRSYFSTVFWFVSLVWFLFPCITIFVVIFFNNFFQLFTVSYFSPDPLNLLLELRQLPPHAAVLEVTCCTTLCLQ